jgi:hypothetical protein
MNTKEIIKALSQLSKDNSVIQLLFHLENVKNPLKINHPQVKNFAYTMQSIINLCFTDALNQVQKSKKSSLKFPFNIKDREELLKNPLIKTIHEFNNELHALFCELQPWDEDNRVSGLLALDVPEYDLPTSNKAKFVFVVKGTNITISNSKAACISFIDAQSPTMINCQIGSILLYKTRNASFVDTSFLKLSSTKSDAKLSKNTIANQLYNTTIYINDSKVSSDYFAGPPNFIKHINSPNIITSEEDIQLLDSIDDSIDYIHGFVIRIYRLITGIPFLDFEGFSILDKDTKPRSRKVPKKESKKLHERHFFECAWCSQKLTEMHHIKEWHLGGANTEENLILLCPNCHTRVHLKLIDESELIKRKSTHLEGDRVSGSFPTTMKEQKFRLGTSYMTDVKHLLVYKAQSMFSATKKNNTLLFSINLYDRSGNLIFWMSNNSYWAPKTFKVDYSTDELTIKNNNEIILRIAKVEDFMDVEFHTFLFGHEFTITPEKKVMIKLSNGQNLIYEKNKISNFLMGIWIADGTDIDQFLTLNNEPKNIKEPGTVYSGNKEADISSIKEHLKKSPKNISLLSALGGTYLVYEDFENAINVFRKATDISPGDPASWSNLGISKYRNNDFQGATIAFEQSLILDEKDFFNWGFLAECYHKSGQFEKEQNASAKQREIDELGRDKILEI